MVYTYKLGELKIVSPIPAKKVKEDKIKFPYNFSLKFKNEKLIVFEGWLFSSNFKKFKLKKDTSFNLKFKTMKGKRSVKIFSSDQDTFVLKF